MTRSVDSPNDKGGVPEGGRKPYVAPRLSVYGRLVDLTRGGVPGSTEGGGTRSAAPSAREFKENFAAVDPGDILARVVTLPIERWNYRGQNRSLQHIGPMAGDFAGAFQVGHDDKHIEFMDAFGVALAAVQGLSRLVEDQRVQLEELRSELSHLRRPTRPATKN